jgi:hypothetical protein
MICTHCGDRIGTYEPVFLIEHGRETSIATEPELLETHPKMLHAACADRAGYRARRPPKSWRGVANL